MKYLLSLYFLVFSFFIFGQTKNSEKLNFQQRKIKNLYLKEKYDKCITIGYNSISKGYLDRLSYYYLALSCYQLYKTKKNKYFLNRSVRYLSNSNYKTNSVVNQIAKNDKKILEDIHLSLIDLAKTEFDENKSKYLKRLNYASAIFGDSTNYIAIWSPTITPKIKSNISTKTKLDGYKLYNHLNDLFNDGYFSKTPFSSYLNKELSVNLNELESKMLNKIAAFYGLSEIEGKKHNDQIISFFHELGYEYIDDDETPWCAAFINYCAKKIGAQYATGLRARNWMKCGKSSSKPSIGDIVVFGYGGKNSKAGHVAMYISEDFDSIYCLGGNQSNMVTISSYCKSDLLGYRKLIIN